MPRLLKFLAIYDYKVGLYLTGALLYYISFRRRPSIGDVFVHFSAVLLLNQYYVNKAVQAMDEARYAELKESSRNYELAMQLEKVSVWDYWRSVFEDRLRPEDYSRILKMRPV